jgi:hypothetical protein
MSTAQHHRERSHRSEKMKRSAIGGMARKARIYDSGARYGGQGLPLIYKLTAMRQKMLESRQKKTAEAGGEKEA